MSCHLRSVSANPEPNPDNWERIHKFWVTTNPENCAWERIQRSRSITNSDNWARERIHKIMLRISSLRDLCNHMLEVVISCCVWLVEHQKCKQVEHAHHTEALASFHLSRYLLPFYLTLPSTLPSTFYLLSYLVLIFAQGTPPQLAEQCNSLAESFLAEWQGRVTQTHQKACIDHVYLVG